MTELEKAQVDMKLEVVVIGVADVDRAKAFYENPGWRLDIDFAVGGDFRGVQMTPQLFAEEIRAAFRPLRSGQANTASALQQ